MKVYEGRREGGVVTVTVNGSPLGPRLDLWNHSPTGFEWGYGGSGPAQLALAILADHLGNDEKAVGLHQEFKQAVIAVLPTQAWKLTTQQIVNALNERGFTNASRIPIALFRIGKIVVTLNASDLLSQNDISSAVRRHQGGDWGEVHETDKQANLQALSKHERLISVYKSSKGITFQVITEADRKITTVLMPEDR